MRPRLWLIIFFHNSTQHKFSFSQQENDYDDDIPSFCLCPITLLVMQVPVACSDGITYERAAIERWLLDSHRSPTMNAELKSVELIPNIALREAIAHFRQSRMKKIDSEG